MTRASRARRSSFAPASMRDASATTGSRSGSRERRQPEPALGLHRGIGERERDERRAGRLRQRESRLGDALRREPRDRLLARPAAAAAAGGSG